MTIHFYGDPSVLDQIYIARVENIDKMLFYSKELESSATDNNYEYNPFLIGKLELESI
jgi:hypothetical protein